MTVLALLATTAPPFDAGELASAAPVADPSTTVQKVNSRPDIVSAAVAARAQGSRVEVESLRTETSSTWSNPDGTMTTDAHTAPIRFKTAGGGWQSIDLRLEKASDGTVAPRAHKLALRLGKRNAAAGQVFASASAGAGRQVEWLAPYKLPDPAINASKATYAEVQPGVDMTVDVRRDGFETDFIVKQRPATAPVWRIPMRTKGLTARPAANGTIAFVDTANVVRSSIPVGYMWDSVKDPHTGEPVHKTAVKVTVEQVSPGKATLVVAPDAAWVMDPKRVFPVTVDPTYATTTTLANFDTFVQTGYTSDLSSAVDLRTGKNGTHTERSFLNFSTVPFAGKDVLSAYLSVYQYGASSCTPSTVYVRSTHTLADTGTRWTNQPTMGTVYGQLSAAKGFSSACPAGRIGIPITPLAQAWSNAAYTVGGLALVASDEAAVNSWKRFHATGGPADPFISFTWNRPPNKPANVETSEAVAYAAPGETESLMYSPGRRPWVRTKATDPDGNTVKYIYEFYTYPNTVVGTCTSSVYASGTTAGCRPANELPENTLVYIRAKANDGRRDGPWTSYNSRLRIGTEAPASPVVSCPAPYGNGTWQDNAPTADVVCTVSATGNSFSAPGYVRLTVDGKLVPTNTTGGVPGQIKITPSSDPAVAKTTVVIPKGTPGLHKIVAQAETPAGKLSGTTNHDFGWGGTSLTSPTATPRITTTGVIRIAAAGPPKGQSATPTAKIRWRVAGYGGDDDTVGWNEDPTALPVVDLGAGGVTVNTQWDTGNAKVDNHLDADPDTAGIQPTTLNDRIPVKLDVQVCFTYSGSSQCTWSQTPGTTIQRVPHAFGNGYPTIEAGPGQIALWTGEFNTSVEDVSVPGYTGDLTISRSSSTYAGPANGVNGVFGYGWVANFNGAEVGAAGLEVVDSSRLDGTIALVDGDGSDLIFESPDGKRRTTANFTNGVWVAADEDTGDDGAKLTVSGTGINTVLAYVEDDGTTTTWTPAAAPTANAATFFRANTVAEAGLTSKTTFTYEASGRVARILAPVPPGVTCPVTTLNPGCRALRFVYTTIGATRVRLGEVWLDIYNPDKAGGAGMDSIKVATYTYDIEARLIKATDPRSNLSTEYTYNASHDLTSVKPAGQLPYQLNYVTVDQRPKLDTVQRDRPGGGTSTVAKIVYAPDVPLSGPGLPDLSAASVARWNQRTAPAQGFAVFGPDHPLSGAPTEGDWQYADLQYADAEGYAVNTATYGAGDWQYTATEYNAQGNTVRALDQRALRQVIDNAMPAGATVDQLASLTVYNEEVRNAAGDTVVTPAGTLVTDSYSPARFAALKDGTVKWIRSHTRNIYDEGAPNAGINPETSMPYRLVTKESSWAHDPGTGSDLELSSQSLNDYAPAVAGDPDGWPVGQTTRSVSDLNLNGTIDPATDIVKVVRYDAEKRIVETRQPRSDGSDAGATKTVYYTAAANASAPECGSKPYWAGLVCKTFPAASPTSATLPAKKTTGYNYLLSPTTVVETSGTVTRTTTMTYLLNGRVKSNKLTVTGLAGSTPVTLKEFAYDAANGQQTVVTAKAADGTTTGTITTGYDTWGRPISYQPSGEQATTTTYDAAGAAATVTDANGSSTYTYDGTDANGKTERRGLATKVVVTTAGSTWSSTAAHDAGGARITHKLPGGITQHNEYDNTGEPVGLRYTGQVTTTDEEGTVTVDPDGNWLSWSTENDVAGRVSREWTPDGASFNGAAGSATPYDRAYSYDSGGRLTEVRDRTLGDPESCTTRTYGFDRNDNRVNKSTATNATCTTEGGVGATRAFDAADRPTTGANGIGNYVYDVLGRATTLPASDAPDTAGGDITLGYYDNDRAKSIAQGGTTTEFTLDASDRRAVETVSGTAGSSTTVRHYTDGSDNPTWTSRGTGSQRYSSLLGSQLAITISQNAAGSVLITNPHGDIVSTSAVANASAKAVGIDSWTNFDEYGNKAGSLTGTGQLSLGWAGSHGRAESGAGLTLMGARLYNPATGLFTSLDPIAGGSANNYTYPADPVNDTDYDGCKRCWRSRVKVAHVFWQIWLGKWFRLWPITVAGWWYTYRVWKDVKFRYRLMWVMEQTCKGRRVHHRWAARYQSQRRYEFEIPVLPWWERHFVFKWGWEYGPGSRAWTSDWYLS